MDGRALHVVDLDLDLWVKPDLTGQLLDEDEFAEHRVKYNYPRELVERIYLTLEEVRAQVARPQYPFPHDIATFVEEHARILASDFLDQE